MKPQFYKKRLKNGLTVLFEKRQLPIVTTSTTITWDLWTTTGCCSDAVVIRAFGSDCSLGAPPHSLFFALGLAKQTKPPSWPRRRPALVSSFTIVILIPIFFEICKSLRILPLFFVSAKYLSVATTCSGLGLLCRP